MTQRTQMIQGSFTAGELSPRMMSRTDLKGYKEGCQEMLNCIPISQGPCFSRTGSYIVKRLTGRSTARLIPFPIKPDEAYMLVMYGNQMEVLQESGLPTATEMLVNSRFQQLSTGWTSYIGTDPGTKGVVTFAVGVCTLNSSSVNPAGIRQQVATVAGHPMTVSVVCFSRSNPVIRIGTVAGASDIGTYQMGSRAVYQIQFTATAAFTWIDVAQDAGAPMDSILSSVSLVDNSPAAQQQFVFTTPYTDNDLAGIQYEIQPAGGVIFLVHPNVPPQKVTYTAPGTFAIEAITFTAPPTEWGTANYPGAITFSDGRLWLSGCPDNPSKIWASKSGAYTDFTIGTAADAALAYQIAKAGAIRWIKGVKSLLVGTDNSEFVISSKDGVITPNDITIEPQSAYGSLSAAPLPLGNQILYIGSDGRRLRAMGYRFEESGWVSTDMTFPSEHITVGKLLEMAWAQNPDNTIWMATASGKMVGCTYDRPNSLIGWHRHEFSTGRVMSVAALRFIGSDMVWVALRYDVQGVQEIHINIMALPGDDAIYVDDSIRAENLTTKFTVITGLNHLEGYTVQIVGDGAVQPEKVVSGGQVTADRACNSFVVGLGFKRRIKTMPIEAAAEPQATETAMKRFNKIYVRVQNALRPIINGTRPPTRFPESPMDLQDPWRSEDIQVMNLGWSRKEELIIEEDQPIPLRVISIFGEMGVSA